MEKMYREKLQTENKLSKKKVVEFFAPFESLKKEGAQFFLSTGPHIF
jgi:hypothetical protein